MSVSRYKLLCLSLLIAASPATVQAQYGFDLEVKKPAPYENRVLKAEKTPEKKIKAPKRFTQNMVTHYNYYFNANNKLNEVIERAKTGHKDDYADLLPFYNYSLDATAGDAMQLDSVIYKAKTGIVLHDLRNDWVDNLYMLWGASYFFRKDFDSAALMFQFINYAFAEKEADGYYRYIGSRMDGNNALSIATKENNSLLKKVFSTAPSRNDAFIWQARTWIESGKMTEAGSLIATLRNDPLFPERLADDLAEVQSYWYYRQGVWDSAAHYLVKALPVTGHKQEQARWEYLAAQMWELAGKPGEAAPLYEKAVGHTTDLVMEVYARLNLVRLGKNDGKIDIGQNIAELLKMARRDKYEEYRDVIYFMAAQMELERGNPAAAQEHLLKAVKYNNGNLASRNQTFLMIADLAYDQKKYIQAAAFYDSVQPADLKAEALERMKGRKAALARLLPGLQTVSRQDSLQRLAALPEEERKAIITKLVKAARKQQGLADENAPTSGSRGPLAPIGNQPPVDLFDNSSKGEWYFYNNTMKLQGQQQFRQTWGNRPNTDNWRRFSDVTNQLVARNNPAIAPISKTDLLNPEDTGPSYESFLKNVPLTPESLQQSNDSIMNALFNVGTVYMNAMEDYASAIAAFERLRSMYPGFDKMDEVLFNLYYAYTKSGQADKAAAVKSLLNGQHGASRFAAILQSGQDPEAKAANVPEATRAYERIYDLFIEGRFDEALAQKKIADSTYRTNYWQPQLLYIEAVYHVRQRADSQATVLLQTIIRQDPASPIAYKAKNLVDVLSRRRQIEDELSRLQIERPAADTVRYTEPVIAKAAPPTPPVQQQVEEKKAPVEEEPVRQPKSPPPGGVIQNGRNETVRANPPIAGDTSLKKPIAGQVRSNAVYHFDPSFSHYAVVVLHQVDPVFASETRNAFSRYNREKYATQALEIATTDFDGKDKFVLVGPFNSAQEAIDYVKAAKALAPAEIIPWLKSDKYSFTIISKGNLEILQGNKDLKGYRQFVEQNLPGKF